MAIDVRLCLRVIGTPDSSEALPPGTLAALQAAATMVVVEPGGISARACVRMMRALRAALPARVPVLAAGRIDLALAAGLDGVVLGPNDVTPGDARRLLPPASIVGVALWEPAQADELYRWRADFACIGAPPAEGGREPELPTPEHLNRVAFRIRLASPGTVVVAMAAADLAPARLIAADANGFWVTLAENGALGEKAARDLRARIDAVLPEPKIP